MAKKLSGKLDFCVFVMFHPESFDTFRSSASLVDQYLRDTFGVDCSRIYLDQSRLEFVYRINRPVMNSRHAEAEFFYYLRETLAKFSKLNAHFTQNISHEGGIRR